MPLVLTLRQGGSLYVGNDKFTLTRIGAEDKVQMTRGRDGTPFEVTIFEKTEIDDDVFAQLGDRVTTKEARIAISASRSKLILSEENYDKPKPNQR
jgi:hypothetical protein